MPGFCKELFVAKKSARVVAHLKHLNLEGLSLNAISVGIGDGGGDVIVIFTLLFSSAFYYSIIESSLLLFSR